jgi:N-acetylglutamate synthase-like GNAT family acetyltransferase
MRYLSESCSESLRLSISRGVPAAAQELIWDVFFVSRHRGISLSAHFPWIVNNFDVICITIESTNCVASNEVVGALVIKPAHMEDVGVIGMLGLVCVNETFRRKGISSLLLSKAINVGEAKGWRALVLWTNQPGVYLRHGFSVDSNDLFGKVQNPLNTPCANVKFSPTKWHAKGDTPDRGIPAFANSIDLITASQATLTVLRTNTGLSVAEWTGNEKFVVQLIECALPVHWWLNVAENDPVLSELRSRGFSMDLHPGSFRMIRPLSVDKSLRVPYINLLDRV